ncbi:hypothetical protein EYF80_037487 [Liparis tanakae]|uniref:Uncharacterized protein n=1 Tax=Liparis tanakae TaxID=230148 RepID=A0A4Z2GHG1_9TELE|nr:hypothetical protein EYF80_037487 [Liparis tanakae]
MGLTELGLEAPVCRRRGPWTRGSRLGLAPCSAEGGVRRLAEEAPVVEIPLDLQEDEIPAEREHTEKLIWVMMETSPKTDAPLLVNMRSRFRS